MSTSDPLPTLQQQVDEIQAIGSNNDVLHLYYAVVQAIEMLSATTVEDDLRSRYGWFDRLCADPETFWNGIDGEPGDPAVTRLIDNMSDWAKDASNLFGQWLTEHQLGTVRLWIYLPCHREYALMQFSPRAGAAAA